MKKYPTCGEPNGKRSGRYVPQPVLVKPSRKTCACGWQEPETPEQLWFTTKGQD